ncbi:hypothetical protein [Flavobacterium sp. 3HN19-14]|uniref:hypothetical protein n=1 Tax=Flavobacterium sp. 3HN19-14 TaxID=3448133 RepID=UPI003EE3EB97
MKTRIYLSFCIIVLCAIGCKNEKPIDDLPLIEPKPADQSKINIVLDMVVPEDDIFQVFYTEDGTANCSEDKSVKVTVKGKEESQKIIFDLPENLKMNFLRIDVGENKSQGEMKMNGMTVQYFDKKFEIKGNQFFKYFSPTGELAVDAGASTITPKLSVKEYDPIFYPLETLKPELEKLLK